jgi:hypothetical protein
MKFEMDRRFHTLCSDFAVRVKTMGFRFTSIEGGLYWTEGALSSRQPDPARIPQTPLLR